jgi:hypothetical protein
MCSSRAPCTCKSIKDNLCTRLNSFKCCYQTQNTRHKTRGIDLALSEEYRDCGQGQFFSKVHVLNPEGDGVQHIAGGIGITVEQAVQEAAYHAITRYRYEWPYLAADYCPFRYFPNAADGAEGVYRSVYASASDHPDPTVRCLVEMLNAKDHRAHCGASMLSQVT